MGSFKSLYKRSDNGIPSSKEKQKKENQLKFVALLKVAETEMFKNPTMKNIRKVSSLKLQLNSLYTNKVEYALFRKQAKFYEDGERASKLLARRLKKVKTRNIITAVKDKYGNQKANEKQINDTYTYF